MEGAVNQFLRLVCSASFGNQEMMMDGMEMLNRL